MRLLNKSKGFTLAEVMIASVILGICVLIIYSIFLKTYSAATRAQAKVIADNLAQQQMETIINRPYNNIAVWAGQGTNVPDNYTVVEKDEGHTTYIEEMVTISTGDQNDYVPYIQYQTISGTEFKTTSIVTWHDDSTDNTAPADPNPHDYKRVHIEVTWGNHPNAATEIVLDRFFSLYYKPDAHGTGTADGGEIRMTAVGATDYLKLGYATTETYSGGATSSTAEAKGANTNNTTGNFNNGDPVAWAYAYCDDDSKTPDIPNAIQKTDGGTDITDGSISIALPDTSYRPAAKTASGISNIIGNNLYGSWHAGEFATEGIWDSWLTPPDWDSGNTWSQPSSIAKACSGEVKWRYSPDIDPLNLAEIACTCSGSKLITSSANADNRIDLRNWTKSDGLQFIDLNDAGGETLPVNGLVRADSVSAWTETRADGQSEGVAQYGWSITNLQVWNRTTHQYDVYNLDSDHSVPSITWPSPIDSASVQIGTVSTDTTANDATTMVTVLQFNVNAATIGSISVPACKVTVGVLKNSVSYTWSN